MKNWNDVRIFLLVARQGSVVAAAGILAIDHSTVSRRISALENDLGARLFDRAGRRLRITPAGERLRAAAEQMEAIMLREVAPIAETGDTLFGCVRIGAPEGLGAGYLGQLMGLVTEQHAGLEVELVALPQNYSLASREVDIAITLDRPTTGNVSVRKLTDYDLVPYASRDFLARHGHPDSPTALIELPICGYIPGLLHTKELAYLDLPLSMPTRRLRSTSILVQRDVIEAGCAWGVLPCFLAGSREALMPLFPEELAITRSYWISVHDDLRGLSRIRVVLDEIVRQVRHDAGRFRVHAPLRGA